MGDVTEAGDLVLQWVPVVDDGGRTRMEARWSVFPGTPVALDVVHAA